MENNESLRIIAIGLLYRRLKLKTKRRRNRSCWVRPINQEREDAGTFVALIQDLREDESKFFDFFRMSIPSFDELHERLKREIKHVNTNMRSCISLEERLAVTLRYLATGSSFKGLHHTFRIGVSTIRNIVKEVCAAIWTVLGEECIPRLTKERFESIAYGFETNANFPLCCGAVGGKHIRIKSPVSMVDHHSVALMAVADTQYHFVYVDVQSVEKDCDASFFKRSTLWKSVVSNELQLEQKSLPETESSILQGTESSILPGTESSILPGTESSILPGTESSKFLGTESSKLSKTESSKFPYFFVGDKTFGLHQHLMRPYGGTQMTPEKKIFNSRLRRAQRFVECAFGILSNKWHILQAPINVTPDFAVEITKACFVLHNFVLDRDGFLEEDSLTVTGLTDLEDEASVRGGLQANSIRDSLKKYFVTSVGALP